MRTTYLVPLAMAGLLTVSLATPICAAEMPTDPRDGKPPARRTWSW